MGIESFPLAGPFGVEVEIDPHARLSESATAELRSLFLRHHLVVIHSDGMSVDETIRISNCVATVLVQDGYQPAQYVSNPGGDAVADSEIPWHIDMNFVAMPHLGASLYAEETDSASGPTLFASSTRAAKKLPDDLRLKVWPLIGLHEHVFPDSPRARHPVLWTHPLTGEPIVFISEKMVVLQERVIEGLDEESERQIVRELFGYLYSPENTYEHRWRTGDLVIWDNLAVQHRRPEKAVGRRKLRRLALVIDGYAADDPIFRIQARRISDRRAAAATGASD
jgi:taurine dioxygenase